MSSSVTRIQVVLCIALALVVGPVATPAFAAGGSAEDALGGGPVFLDEATVDEATADLRLFVPWTPEAPGVGNPLAVVGTGYGDVVLSLPASTFTDLATTLLSVAACPPVPSEACVPLVKDVHYTVTTGSGVSGGTLVGWSDAIPANPIQIHFSQTPRDESLLVTLKLRSAATPDDSDPLSIFFWNSFWTLTPGATPVESEASYTTTHGALDRFAEDLLAATSAGSPMQSFTLTAQDGKSNPVDSYDGVVRFTTSDPDPEAKLPPPTRFAGASHTFPAGSIVLLTSGAQTVSACDDVLDVCVVMPVTVDVGSVVEARLSTTPGCPVSAPPVAEPLVAGDVRDLHAVGFDAIGNCVGPVSVAWSVAPAAGETSPGTVAPATGTQTQFTAKTARAAGHVVAKLGDASVNGTEYEVREGAATKLLRVGSAEVARAAGDATTLSVRVTDDHDNGVPGVQVSWTGCDAVATTVTGADGSTSSRLRCTQAGLQTVQATSSTVGATVVSFDVLTIAGAPATMAADAANPTQGVVGESVAVCVLVSDAFGNAVGEGVAVSWLPVAASAASSTTPTDATGKACADLLLAQAAGENRVLAARAGVLAPVLVTVEGVASTADAVLCEETCARDAVEAGKPQPLSAKVVDEFGNPVEGATVAWTGLEGATVTPATSVTDASGIAKAVATADTEAGANSVRASVTGATQALFTFQSVAGPLATVVVECDDAVAGATFVCRATGEDAFGNPQTVPAARFTATDADEGDVEVSQTDLTEAEITAPTDVDAGPVTVTATTTGAGSRGAPVIEGALDVPILPAALASIRVSTSSDACGTATTARTFTAQQSQKYYAFGLDEFQNCRGLVAATWAVSPATLGTVSPASGTSTTFVAKKTGSGTLTATSGTVVGPTATITVARGEAVSVTILDGATAAGALSLTADQTKALSVIGTDAEGNTAPEPTAAWSVVTAEGPACGTVTATGATTTFDATRKTSATSACKVRVTVGGIEDDTGVITVSPGARARIAVTPSAPTVSADSWQRFAVGGTDADGNAVDGAVTATWALSDATCGTLEGTGAQTSFYPAKDVPCVLTATSGAQTAQATIDIVAGEVKSLTLRTAAGGSAGRALVAPLDLTTDDARVFYAAGYDAYQNYAGDVAATWSVSTGPTLSTIVPETGAFDPKHVGTVRVTATYNGLSATSGDIRIALGAFDGLKLRSAASDQGTEVASLALASGASATVFAARYDADGNWLEDDATVTWSVRDACGTLGGTSGVSTTFTAGYYPLPDGCALVATSAVGSKSDSATVAVTPPPVGELRIVDELGAPIGPLALKAGEKVMLNATGYDAAGAGGHLLGPKSVTWSVVGACGSIGSPSGSSVNFTATTTGSCGLKATLDTVENSTVSFSVTPGPLAELLFTAAPATTDADTPRTFAAIPLDAFENLRADVVTYAVLGTDANGTIDANGLFVPEQAGRHVVEVASGDVRNTTVVLVTVGQLDEIRFSTAPTTTPADQQPAFVAYGLDANDNVRVGDVIVYSVDVGGTGSIGESTGVFTPSGLGLNTVRACSGEPAVCNTTSITVTAGALASIELIAPPTEVTADTTTVFLAKTYDVNSNPRADTIVYEIVSGPGSIDAAGLFKPKQTGTTVVKASFGGLSDTATIETKLGGLHNVTFDVTHATTDADTTKTFHAVPRDIQGNARADLVTYSIVLGGSGAIDATSGLFTPALRGTTTVKACSGAVCNTTDILVVPGAVASVVFTTAPSTTDADTPVTFVAVGRDGKGNDVATPPAYAKTGSGAIGAATGLFTPQHTGTTTIAATVGDKSSTVALVVTPGEATDAIAIVHERADGCQIARGEVTDRTCIVRSAEVTSTTLDLVLADCGGECEVTYRAVRTDAKDNIVRATAAGRWVNAGTSAATAADGADAERNVRTSYTFTYAVAGDYRVAFQAFQADGTPDGEPIQFDVSVEDA